MTRPRWQDVQVIGCAMVIGWALAYALCDWSGWPRLTYDPYVGRWYWAAGPTQSVPINYQGNLLWGVGGGVVAGLAAAAGLAMWRRPLPPALLDLSSVWAVTAVGLAGTYYTWNLWPF